MKKARASEKREDDDDYDAFVRIGNRPLLGIIDPFMCAYWLYR